MLCSCERTSDLTPARRPLGLYADLTYASTLVPLFWDRQLVEYTHLPVLINIAQGKDVSETS